VRSNSSIVLRPLLALLMVMLFLAAGPWPVTSAEADWTTVDKIDSGSTTRFLDVAWNPCSKEALIVGFSGELRRYTPSSIDKLETNTTVQLSAVAWKPDCSEALIVGASGTVLVYKDSKVTKLNSGITNLLQDIAWTNDGKAVIAAGIGGVLWYDGTKFTLQAIPDTGIELFGIAWNPEGTWGVVVGQSMAIYKFDATSIKKVTPPVAAAPDTSLYKASFHPDGSMVTIVGQKGTVIDFDGTTFPYVTAGGGGTVVTFLNVDWGSYKDYALLVGDTGTVLCYRKENDYPCIPSSLQWGLIYGADWSSDGKEALIVGNNGVLLKYPGTKAVPPPAGVNSMAVAFLVIVLVLLAVGIGYLYLQDAQERRKKKAKFEKRRSKRHGRRSKHQR
jgi:WD40 repeat protein